MLTVAELNSFIVGNKSRNCLLKVKARKDRNCYGKVKNKMVWHRMFENIHRILKGLLLGELCAASLHSFWVQKWYYSPLQTKGCIYSTFIGETNNPTKEVLYLMQLVERVHFSLLLRLHTNTGNIF